MTMTPQQLSQRLEKNIPTQLVDVREPDEFAIANIGGVLIPLGELTQRYQELDPGMETVVLCHHGSRSAQACAFLKQCGFPKVFNLSGGIDEWSQVVDPCVPRY